MRIPPTLQIAIALVILTSAILLVLNLLFGVFPEPDLQLRQQRAAVAEKLAAQATVLLQRGDHKALEATLARVREQDPTIRSLSVRRADRTVLAQSGAQRDPPAASAQAAGDLVVPLTAGGERWGSFEVAYAPDPRGALYRMLQHPLWITFLGVALLGTLIYWAYLRRALVHLDPKSVIPERVRQAFDVMTEGVVVLDNRGRILLANDAFRAFPGDSAADPVGKRLSDLPWLSTALGPDAAEHPWMRAMQQRAPVMNHALDAGVQLALNKKLVVSCAPIADSRGNARGCIATFSDLTALHLANERLRETLAELSTSRDEIQQKNIALEHLATHDALTGCLTRRAFLDRMAHAREEAGRNGTALTCLALDIDHFKSVNDRFGHIVGDRVAQEIGRLLVATLRNSDIVGRYGGDELFAGMPGCSLEQGLLLAEKVRRAIEECRPIAAGTTNGLRVTVSIGVASLDERNGAVAHLIDRADKALYRAKAEGRNRVASSPG